MSKEREILQRFQAGMSQRSIALGMHVSRNIVAKVIAAYRWTGHRHVSPTSQSCNRRSIQGHIIKI